MVPVFCAQAFFAQAFLWPGCQCFFVPSLSFVLRFSLPRLFFVPRHFCVQTFICDQVFLGPDFYLCPRFFGSRLLFVLTFFGSRLLFVTRFFWVQTFICAQVFWIQTFICAQTFGHAQRDLFRKYYKILTSCSENQLELIYEKNGVWMWMCPVIFGAPWQTL